MDYLQDAELLISKEIRMSNGQKGLDGIWFQLRQLFRL